MTSKTVAILQSNYIPWKGYFELINKVDEFILLDDVQYTRRDWRNRNKIKTSTGLLWLTIPVQTKGHYFQKINDIKILDSNWASKHWQTIKQNYSKAKYFKENEALFESIYSKSKKLHYLSEINQLFITTIKSYLNIDTKISLSSDYNLIDGKTERLVELCKQVSATHYLSGPAAQSYICPQQFKEAKIKLEWMDYSHHKEYEQLYPPFEHGVTILDMIFNLGSKTAQYIKE